MTELEERDDGDGDDWDDGSHGREWRADDEPGDDGDGSDRADVDPDHAAAVRTVRLVVAALVLALLGGLSFWLSGTLGDDEEAADDPAVAAGGAGIVGPADGQALEGYVAERVAALATVDGPRVAVVSLVSYRPDTAVAELLAAAGAADAEVLGRLVALPGGAATPIDVPVEEWLGASRSSLQAERDEIAALLPTIEDPNDPFIAGYTEELALLDAQLAALDPAGDLVFGVVLRADPGALRRLAERPEVRLVDVAPDAELGPLAGYRGLRPDELDVAGTPPTRPG